MATQSREPTVEEEQERGLLGQIEVHSIDWIPDTERHGKTWQQAMLWFLGNFQYFTIPIGFVGPALGLSLGWSILAGALGICFGTLFMAFHATQGPVFGLPQMIQTRAQLGYRGVVVALFAVLFTYMAFNVADQVLMSTGLHGAFGWNAHLVAAGTAVLAALLAIFGYDWVHRVFRFLLVISFPCYAIISVAILIGHAGGHAPITPASSSRRSWPSSRWRPPTTSPTHRTCRTTPATCRVRPRLAGSSARCSSAPRARRSG